MHMGPLANIRFGSKVDTDHIVSAHEQGLVEAERL
jgi:hypothetical protein